MEALSILLLISSKVIVVIKLDGLAIGQGRKGWVIKFGQIGNVIDN